jgi:hypothetical protein
MLIQKPFATVRCLTRVAALGVAAGTLLGLALPAAAADSCLDQVRDLASQHGTPSKPPVAAPDGKGGGATTQELARSGGVIAPPPMDDKSVIKPPPTGNDRMQTVPDIAPQAQSQQDTPASDRTKLQAALTAARAQAERGDEKGCQEALARARTLAERSN